MVFIDCEAGKAYISGGPAGLSAVIGVKGFRPKMITLQDGTVVERQKVEKVVNLLLNECGPHQICSVCRLTDGQLQELVKAVEFEELYQGKLIEQQEARVLRDKGWEGIEDLGIGQVLSYLQASTDPEFSLKAAMVANKAHKTRSVGNKTLDPGASAGRIIAINLNARFVQKITNQTTFNQMQIRQDGEKRPLPPKQQFDILGPKRVEQVLDLIPEDDAAESIKASILQHMGT